MPVTPSHGCAADIGNEDVTEPATREIFRLVRKDEINDKLLEKALYIRWPDDGVWYRAKIKKVAL